jgi:hypothetical protein
VSGTADVFEASFTLELRRPDGALLGRADVTASSGSGTRGSFSAQLACHARGRATLSAFAASAEDGSPTARVDVPLVLG